MLSCLSLFAQNKSTLIITKSNTSKLSDFLEKVSIATEARDKSKLIKKDPNEIVYHILFSESDLFIDLGIKCRNGLPQDYFFKDIVLSVPFTEGGRTNNIIIRALYTKELFDKNVTVLGKLWKTNINALKANELFELYQVARVMAGFRIGDFTDGYTNPSAYDIQLVYKYLEIVKSLTLKTFFVPDKQDLDQAIYWLEQAKQNAESRAKKAIGSIVNVDQMIAQSKASDAYRFQQMWRIITNTLSNRRKFLFLKQYYKTFNNLENKEDREFVVAVTKITESEILLSMGYSLNVYLNSVTTVSKEWSGEVKKLIEYIDNYSDGPTAANDKLRQLKRSLQMHLR